jgi:hypothetical protein
MAELTNDCCVRAAAGTPSSAEQVREAVRDEYGP